MTKRRIIGMCIVLVIILGLLLCASRIGRNSPRGLSEVDLCLSHLGQFGNQVSTSDKRVVGLSFDRDIVWGANWRKRQGAFDISQLQDDDLSRVSRLTSLRELDLSTTLVTDKGTSKLMPLNNLRVLDVSNTPITEQGVKSILGMRSLGELRIDSSQRSPEISSGIQRSGNYVVIDVVPRIPNGGQEEIGPH